MSIVNKIPGACVIRRMHATCGENTTQYHHLWQTRLYVQYRATNYERPKVTGNGCMSQSIILTIGTVKTKIRLSLTEKEDFKVIAVRERGQSSV